MQPSGEFICYYEPKGGIIYHIKSEKNLEIILLASLVGLIFSVELFASGLGAPNDPDDDSRHGGHEGSGEEGTMHGVLNVLLNDPDEGSTLETVGTGTEELGPSPEPGSNLVGTIGDDTITGWNELYGGSGNDYIAINNFGGEYQAVGTAYGGIGDDTIFAEAGSDNDGLLFGGAGDDLLVGHSGAYFDAGSGDDTVVAMSTASHDGTVLTGDGNDVVIIQPFATKGAELSDQDAVTLRVEDFDQMNDDLGILLDPDKVRDLNLVAETVNGGNDTRLSLFVSDKVNGIEANAPIQVILSGVNDPSNLELKLYKMINETEYECFGTITIR